MSLHAIADHLASKGRNGDSLLMHVTPGELHGLQGLAVAKGGTLTINPETGLPEASFLKDWLPAILGIGAMVAAPFTGGLSLAGTAMLGGAVAGGTSLATGNSLKKSLLTGFMVDGGGALAGGMGGLSAGAVEGAAGTFGAGAGQTFGNVAMQGARTAFPAAAEIAGMGAGTGAGTFGAGAGQMFGNAAMQGARTALPSAVAPVGEMTALAPGAAQASGAVPYFTKAVGWANENPKTALGIGAAGLLGLSQMSEPRYKPATQTKGNIEEYSFDQGYDPTGADGYFFHPSYTHTGTTKLAGGGMLGGYSDGGQTTRGPGDGMSDSIPASIEGKQPARLADSEFVVPADVVSHIGNGSSQAGSKKLYAMMDRIRKARTGHKHQSPKINAEGMLPV